MTTPQPKPYLAHIKPYQQGKTSDAANITPIKLSSNENPYGASPKAIQAYNDTAISLHRYPEGSCAELRQALASKHGLQATNILCGAGSDELINLLIGVYAGSGDEVLFTEHAFLMYRVYTLANGATPVEAPETKLKADSAALLNAVTERTKILFLANPNNPTGSYLNKDELYALREKLPAHIILAIDGAYAECVDSNDYDNGLSLTRSTENTVCLRTFSKLYGLPSLRLGWMTACTDIINAVGRLKSPFNVSSAAQAAGLAALEDDTFFEQQRTHMLTYRKWLRIAFTSLGYHVYPSQGNFILVDFGSTQEQQRIIAGLEAQHIYIRDVTSYKLPTCGRITVGTVEENETLIAAMKELSA